MYSNKDLCKLILPLIIEQVLAVTIGIADTVMVSSAGEAAVSGISLIDSINILLINLFTAMATGGAIIATQYIGSKQPEKARNSAAQLEVTVAVIASVIMVACVLLRQTDDPIEKIAQEAGFADIKSFCRVFKKYTGLTPRQYRQ